MLNHTMGLKLQQVSIQQEPLRGSLKTLKPVPFPPLQKEFTEAAKAQQVAGLSLSLSLFFCWGGRWVGWEGRKLLLELLIELDHQVGRTFVRRYWGKRTAESERVSQ